MTNDINQQLQQDAAECADVARKYPAGTKIVQANGGPTGEVVRIEPDGRTIVVRTAGVERKVGYQIIDQYVAQGRVTIG